MNAKQGKIVGVILILVAIVIGAVSIYQYKRDQSKAASTKLEERTSVINVEENSSGETKQQEQVPDEDVVDFEMEGLNEEAYEMMDTTEEMLAKRLYEWTQNEQDYGTAIGVAFYPDCQVDLIEQKYTFTMQTIVGEDSYPEESRIITLDYYKKQGSYDIHP